MTRHDMTWHDMTWTFFRNEPLQIAAMTLQAKRKPRTPSESACTASAGRQSCEPDEIRRCSGRNTVGALANTSASPGQTDSDGVRGFRLASWAMAAVWRGSLRKKVI